MWFRFVGLILFVLPCAAQITAQTTEPPFTLVSDVQYCTGGGTPLLMDVFIPEHRNGTPTPTVLWIHGGGSERGDKSGNSGAHFLANGGFDREVIQMARSGSVPRHNPSGTREGAGSQICFSLNRG